MQINPRNHVPIYLQIADGIREAVAAGVYQPGEALPSLRALALEIHVNPNTVQKAYDELARSGLVYSERGRGLFVAEQGTAEALSGAEEAVRRSFDEAVRAGQAAGMRPKEIRRLFEASLRAGNHERTGQEQTANQRTANQRTGHQRTGH